jgi:hypothetical protein
VTSFREITFLLPSKQNPKPILKNQDFLIGEAIVENEIVCEI